MIGSQNARGLSARWNLKENESAVEKKLKKCNQFSLGKLPVGKLFCKFNTTTKRRKIELRIIEWVVRSLSTLRNAFFVRNFRVNMVAAIDWRSHTTHGCIWFVSFLGFNGPTYCSRYRAVSKRGRKKAEKIDELTNVQTTQNNASALGHCPTIIPISRTPRNWKFT